MSTSLRYLFGSISDRLTLAEPFLEGVSMSSQLNDWGTFRGTIRLDTTGVDNEDVVNATVPGKSWVVAERDGTVVWDGIVWSSTYESQGKTFQITARETEAYPGKITMPDYSFSGDPKNAMRNLWSTMQSLPNCNLGVDIPGTFTTVTTVDISTLASDRKYFFDRMTAVADGEGTGFDWKIRTTKDGDTYRRVLTIGTPLLGATDASNMSFEYPGNILNYWRTDGITNAGTHLFLQGSGDGSDALVATATQQTMLNNGFPRYDLVLSRKDIDNLTLLQSMATQLGTQRRPPLSTIKVVVKGDLDPLFGSYGLGDMATLAIRDPRHPNGFQADVRLIAWEYQPEDSQTIEQATLVFEGDELND